MTKFIVRKNIPLNFLGKGWEDAYVDFSPFTFSDNDKILHLRRLVLDQQNMTDEEAKKASKEIMDILKDKFIEGKGFDGKELVEITKDSLEELPMEIIIHILQTIQGQGILPKNA